MENAPLPKIGRLLCTYAASLIEMVLVYLTNNFIVLFAAYPAVNFS